ncbi:sugar phosphate isomerase/epimerase family protein [Pseudomonas azerbaijanorientalis]|jgi:sugar phosphate isomerase/epimerase|uniref:sugar phosphate isomerase/epimerase family protein n=1 Tax=Pseudomonas azerbaijanorientalis TaxID=2842350 RepID=UPI001C3D0627|nr:TIM barrel protein [Pseudomonas azerbaijanorientalis]QXH59409.1 sugar phosphate isomerase/epimerase [Pseudomonas azerbaijanorientalis]
MAHRIHALDSFFYSSMGVYAFQTQCEMLAEIGYDGITVAAWGGTPLTDLSLLPSVRENHGLHIEGLYVVLHEGRNDALIRRIVETVEGVELIELAIQTTVNGAQAILRFIETLLPIAERRGLRIALYPHLHHVTQTTTQVVQICELFAHPRLGASFNGYHWYASQEGELELRLAAMKPWLMQVVTSGSALSQLGWGGVATMEPVDRGEMDNFALIAALNRVGYTGSIGVLGWDYGGDIYLKLQRCLATLREIDQRLERHPSWSEFPLK